MRNLKIILPFLLLLCSITVLAQDESTDNEEISLSSEGVQGFHFGIFIGSFFANNYSASLYDGYGVNVLGNRNDWATSVMVQRMYLDGMDSINSSAIPRSSPYSDIIGPTIGLNHDQWHFESSDMPTDVRYRAAFMFGLNLQYGISKTEGFIFNANFAKLNITGNFTITSPYKKLNPSLGDSVLYFGISGQEQRFMFQVGYSRLLGNPSGFNFLIEAGALMNNAQYLSNYANINELKIDLTPFTSYAGYQTNYLPHEYSAIGYGAFAGIGCNINVNPKYIL
jgi:hypothetical protein